MFAHNFPAFGFFIYRMIDMEKEEARDQARLLTKVYAGREYQFPEGLFRVVGIQAMQANDVKNQWDLHIHFYSSSLSKELEQSMDEFTKERDNMGL
jgi:hypothetical protein